MPTDQGSLRAFVTRAPLAGPPVAERLQNVLRAETIPHIFVCGQSRGPRENISTTLEFVTIDESHPQGTPHPAMTFMRGGQPSERRCAQDSTATLGLDPRQFLMAIPTGFADE
jgi:hypothetical protein